MLLSRDAPKDFPPPVFDPRKRLGSLDELPPVTVEQCTQMINALGHMLATASSLTS